MKTKKIVILTHRLGANYGGLLQAYALQRLVEKMALNTEVTTTHLHPLPSLQKRIISSVGVTVKRRRPYINSLKLQKQIQKETLIFLSKYIKQENLLPKSAEIYIVGSDQVWRAKYIDPVKYMFDGLEDRDVKRISYAASFGTDDLSEYRDEQIKRTAKLAKKFSGISVREDSGVGIVKDHWALKAEHHVDPTLLLDREDYAKLIDNEPTKAPSGTLFVYVLDRSLKNDTIIDKVEKLSHTKRFELMPKEYRSFVDFLRNKDDYIMPKVEQWLRSFRDAEFVVTDSFHGTVFSIIFNKPFVAIGNGKRGLARFVSLLKMFDLEKRLVVSVDDVTENLVNHKIDWNTVNEKIRREQARSARYLRRHIK